VFLLSGLSPQQIYISGSKKATIRFISNSLFYKEIIYSDKTMALFHKGSEL